MAGSLGEEGAELDLGLLNLYGSLPDLNLTTNEINLDSASFWMKLSANKGDSAAENDMGVFYRNGIGVPKNDTLAVFWFQRSMNHGSSEGKGNYGEMLYEGKGGLNRDQKEGRLLIEDAATKSANFAEYLKTLKE